MKSKLDELVDVVNKCIDNNEFFTTLEDYYEIPAKVLCDHIKAFCNIAERKNKELFVKSIIADERQITINYILKEK